MKTLIALLILSLSASAFPNQYSGAAFSSKYQVKAKGLVADYKFYLDSGSTIVDRSGNGNNLTMTAGAGCTFSGMGLTCTGTNSSNIVISNALFAQAQTIVYIGTTVNGGYRAIIGSGVLNFMFDQQQQDLWIYNSGQDAHSNRQLPIIDPVNGNTAIYQGMGYSRCISWVRGATADKFYLEGNEVVGYQAQNGNANYAPGGNTLTLFSSPISGSWGLNNTAYRVLFFNYALSASEIKAYVQPLRYSINAIVANSGGNAGNQVGVFGNSISAGSTLPLGPGTNQSSGWDVANLLTAGNSVSTANSLTSKQRLLLSAVQGITTPAENGVNVTLGTPGSSGGPPVVSLSQTYDFAALRHIAIGFEGTNYFASANGAQEIAARASMVSNLILSGWDVVMMTTPVNAAWNATVLGYDVASSNDCKNNYQLYGALACYDLMGIAALNPTTTPGNFWDGLHANTTGQPILVNNYRQALNSVFIY